MRTPPPDLAEDDIATVLAARWRLQARALRHLPVGFGSHHWLAETGSGEFWFVTADAVAAAPGRAELLSAALTTAERLRRDAGLSFVVAPVRTPDGELLATCGGYRVAVYPHLDECPGPRPSVAQFAGLLAELHAATDRVRDDAPVDDLDIDDRADIERVLRNPDQAAAPGPYGRSFLELIGDHRDRLRASLADHDHRAAALRIDRSGWVITHGEPKPDNVMITDAGPMLIDWDTARLAPPARDLWMVGSVIEYQQLTDRRVPDDQLDFYRARWDLTDLAAFAGWFVRPHQASPDTEIGWRACVDICRSLETGA